jgi:hypothetical protein
MVDRRRIVLVVAILVVASLTACAPRAVPGLRSIHSSWFPTDTMRPISSRRRFGASQHIANQLPASAKLYSTVQRLRRLLQQPICVRNRNMSVSVVGDCEFGAVAVMRQLDAWQWQYRPGLASGSREA